MLVEVTDFVGEIALPFDMRNIKETKLCKFIEQYEPIWLRSALGYDFYKLFAAALAGTPAARWVLLRDGGDWTYNGETRYFGGVRPLIRSFVYYYYMRNEATITTQQGEKKSKSEYADNSNLDKAIQQWNKMSLGMGNSDEGLWDFLSYAEDEDGDKLFSEFEMDRVDVEKFRSQNPLNI